MSEKARAGGGPGKHRVFGDKSRRPKHAMKTFKRLMSLMMENYKAAYLVVFLAIIGSSLATLRGTLFLRKLVDTYILPLSKSENPDYSLLARALASLAVTYLLGVACVYLYNRLTVYICQGTLQKLRLDLYEHMESLPLAYFDSHARGDIMSVYTNDIDTLRQMLGQSIPQLLNSSVTILITIVSMVLLDIPLTVITLAMVGLMFFAASKIGGQAGKHFVKQQADLGAVNGYIEEMMKGQKVVKVFCHEEKNIEEFRKVNDSLRDSANYANRFANIMMPVNGNLGNISYVLCVTIGALLAINGFWGLSLGTLVSFLTLNRNFTMPVVQVSQQMNSVIMAMAGADRVFKLMDEESEGDEGYVRLVNVIEEADGSLRESQERTGLWAWKHPHQTDGSVTYQKLEGDVEFEHVDFGYIPEKTVLKDIQLFAKPGQKIAFVGSTGAGKTTITNLINRFYDIQRGKIRFDGINVQKIKKGDLRRSLGMVLQDTHLFSGTVMDNIRYGRLDASDEECRAAARLANADGFIRRLPNGYDTVLRGDGGNLSQGQRQLLAIARAAVADPPALILDEATSSIDTRTETLVQRGMDQLMKGRTTFVIAHRLSTVRNADCIMVLEQGKIIERGSHEQLMEMKGRYHQLYTGNQISAE